MKNSLVKMSAAFLVAATVATSAVAADGSLTKIKLADLAQSLNGIASNVMIDQGFDKKHGLDVEYVTYPTLDGLFNAIRGKQVDVGFGGWTGFAQFRAGGFPVKTIFPVGRGATLDVIVPVDSPIGSMADLEGKRVASYAGAAGSATALFRVLTSNYYGYDLADDGLLQYTGPGLIPTLVEQGEVDAGLLFDPLAAKAVASGKFKSIANLADLYKEKTGDEFLWIALATNDEFAEENPEALESFIAAWRESVQYVKNNDEVFVGYGQALGLDESGIKLLRDRVVSDYATTWDDKYIESLFQFAAFGNQVMGKGFLENIPKDAFTTEYAQ